MSAPEVSVCVAVYRHHEVPNVATLAAALDAAFQGITYELIVVLNGITADGLGLPPEARTVELDCNHGVSIAWNRAAALATGDVLCFVNDDLVPGPNSLAMLARVLQRHPEAGVVGPVPTLWDVPRARHRAYVEMTGRPAGELVACDVVSGFCFATRASAFRELGGFDEAYSPAGFEEVDYYTAVRVRLELGCFGVAGVDVQHDFGVSAADPTTVIRFLDREETLGSIAKRNRAHFLAKWAGVEIASTPVPSDQLRLPPHRLRVLAHHGRRAIVRRFSR